MNGSWIYGTTVEALVSRILHHSRLLFIRCCTTTAAAAAAVAADAADAAPAAAVNMFIVSTSLIEARQHSMSSTDFIVGVSKDKADDDDNKIIMNLK
jgi:hypothetical protein